VRDEQLLAIAFLGLIVWNLAAYMTSLPTVTSVPSSPPVTVKQGEGWFQQFLTLFKPFSCALQSIWNLPGLECGPAPPTTPGTPTPQQQQPNPWFFPVFILTLASYVNVLWILVGYVSLVAHGRFEIQDSMGFAAIQALFPILLPVMILLQVLESGAPSRSVSRTAKSMEA
jgi:hypothetical protein